MWEFFKRHNTILLAWSEASGAERPGVERPPWVVTERSGATGSGLNWLLQSVQSGVIPNAVFYIKPWATADRTLNDRLYVISHLRVASEVQTIKDRAWIFLLGSIASLLCLRFGNQRPSFGLTDLQKNKRTGVCGSIPLLSYAGLLPVPRDADWGWVNSV